MNNKLFSVFWIPTSATNLILSNNATGMERDYTIVPREIYIKLDSMTTVNLCFGK